jgi:hypothetical protein
MFQILWINQAIVNGSGSRACGFFSSEACFSEIDTGPLMFTPKLLSEDAKLTSHPQSAAPVSSTPTAVTSAHALAPRFHVQVIFSAPGQIVIRSFDLILICQAKSGTYAVPGSF